MRRPLLTLLASAALSLAACGGERESAAIPGESASAPAAPEPTGAPAADADASAPTGAPPASADGNCTKKVEDTGAREQPCPTSSLVAAKANVVVVKTNRGSFEITLDTKRAPVTSNSFAYLVTKRFYDGLIFHRVVPEFVIQGGDPVGAGTGGPGYMVTEAPPSDLAYTRGVVAMAKGGADPSGASGSQFFVVSAADVGLPPDYALVGKVTKGLGTIDEITSLGVGDGVPPREEIKITSARLSGR